ncbi:MAG: protein kinase [Ignavibacteriae bacterium]|nr:protein kinase [Ignavibacteria bacterium]MBI3363750.1 protein kinase [Ignavibacteriota bacterium]
MIGTTVSHYKILEKLGEGGMGVVYKAQDTSLDRLVALKFLPERLSSSSESKTRFIREAKTAATLNHPNVCVIHEIDEYHDQQYIAMEYVDGMTLKKKISSVENNERMPIRDVITYAIQIGEALHEAHTRGIIHRDVKSDNIMVNSKNQLKVMDFGLAKMKGSLGLTRTLTTVGTLAYMAPEQIQGGDADARSDIFSLGVVFYEMLTGGKLPFRGEHEAAMMYSIVYEEPIDPQKFGVEIPLEAKHVLAHALMKNREDRYQSAAEMVKDLQNILSPQSTMIGTRPSSMKSTIHVRKSSTRWLLVSAILVGGVLIICGYMYFMKGDFVHRGSGKDNTTLAVLSFDNFSDPEDKDHTGEMIANLLITSLSQVKGLEVISNERLSAIQNELGHPAAKNKTPDLATTIAHRAGVGMMLLGSILQHHPTLVVTARLIDVETGKILAAQQIVGVSGSSIFALVDSLAQIVKDDLRISPGSSSETKSLSEVTTTSAEAYRSYLAGLELQNKLYWSEGEAALKKAIQLDSTFALAYLALGDVRKAWQFSGKVTEKERMQIHAAYLKGIEKKTSQAIDILEQLVAKYPHELSAYYTLQEYYYSLFQFEKAIDANLRAARIDSLDKVPWQNLAYLYADQNRQREALDAADQYVKLSPAEPNPYDTKGDVYAKFGEGDSAMIWYKQALSFRPDFYNTAEKIGFINVLQNKYDEAKKYFQQYGSSPEIAKKAWAEIDAVCMMMHQGTLKDAEQRLLKLAASHRAKKLQEHLLADYSLLTHIARARNDNTALLAYAESYAAHATNDKNNLVRGMDVLARAYAAIKESTKVREILGEIGSLTPHPTPGFQLLYHRCAALVAYDEQRYSDALHEFNNVFEIQPPNLRDHLPYGICLFKAGRTGEAIAEFQQQTNYFPEDTPDRRDWPITSVISQYWTGVAYEQQHDIVKAIESYNNFMRIWKDADRDLPVLISVRSRLERLRKMGA